MTKRVLESALEGEITNHPGYDKHDVEARGSGNSRNGTRAKTVLTDVGPVEVEVPRDVAGSFEPQIVTLNTTRSGCPPLPRSTARTSMETAPRAHHESTRCTIANNQRDPFNRPDRKIVDRTKIRDGQVANRPIFVVMAVIAEGHRDILGIWAGDGGEGAK